MTDDRPIEQLATEWLRLERLAVENPSGVPVAVEAATAFEVAVREAAPEDLLLAWQAATRNREVCEPGGQEWADAREVERLLKMEYEAGRG